MTIKLEIRIKIFDIETVTITTECCVIAVFFLLHNEMLFSVFEFCEVLTFQSDIKLLNIVAGGICEDCRR